MILRLIVLFHILLSRQSLTSAGTTCFQPFVPENGHVIFDEAGPYEPQTIAKYSCALGFELIGEDERECLSDGTWSGVAPFCAIDVAHRKPSRKSSGEKMSHFSKGFCTRTEAIRDSWWEVDLLGSYSLQAVSVRLGSQSSQVTSIEYTTIKDQKVNCDLRDVIISSDNVTVLIPCAGDDVMRIRITTSGRLHLCSLQAFATNAVSSWQCAQGNMDVLGVFDSICFSASRDEQSDWLGAQRKCLDRGASLPMRMTSSAQRGLQSALSSDSTRKAFYWIGVTSSMSDWRWADGETISQGSDWATEQAPMPGMTEAVSLASPLDWKWLPSSQSAWNAFLCQNKPKFCTSPGVGEAARVAFSSPSYAIGTFCYYSCEEGYYIVGNRQRECRDNGRWSGSIPECKPRDCGSLDSWAEYGNVVLLNGSTTFQHQAEYMCAEGWQIVGQPIRQCLANGRWSGQEPTCKELDCGKPHFIPNGQMNYTSTTFESKVKYACLENYRLIGHEELVCSAEGQWSPSVPVCYDLATLREMKGDNSDNNIVLAVLALVLVAGLIFTVFRFSRSSSIVPLSEKNPAVIYASPSIQPNGADSVIYYASTAAMTQLEIPPHLLSLQHLPNGNIHVTMPFVSGRPMVRPQIPVFQHSPTPSQLLYSFDHEPIYDTPPINSDTFQRTENVYERLPDRPPPPLPKKPPPAL